MQKLSPLRGTKDILPEDYDRFENIINIAKNIAYLYNFKTISTPLIENSEVFLRSIGETSDIVSKEIYQFKGKANKNGLCDNIALRPEFTAGIARAFISNGMAQDIPVKLFSYGPLFRYERPQKGRQRQFHQVNFEAIGYRNAVIDAEMILAAYSIIESMGVDTSSVSLHINSLGGKATIAKYTAEIRKILANKKEELSPDSQRRLQENPLRILDSKDKSDKELIKDIPPLIEFLDKEHKEHYEQVIDIIASNCKVNIIQDKYLVRGLDYYTDIVFELISTSAEVGSQAALVAGGRYDDLIAQMGGVATPAFGFAVGIERLMLLAKNQIKRKNLQIAIICDFSCSKDVANNIENRYHNVVLSSHLNFFRAKQISTDVIFGKNFGKKLQKAEKLGAEFALILNDFNICDDDGNKYNKNINKEGNQRGNGEARSKGGNEGCNEGGSKISNIDSSVQKYRVKNLSHKLIIERELTLSLDELVAILKDF